jgi:hypothetical protein
MIKEDTVPCEVCGVPTEYKGTMRCINCWEVESRLDCYLRSEKGLQFVIDRILVRR